MSAWHTGREWLYLSPEEIRRFEELCRKHYGRGELNIDYLHAALTRDKRAAEQGITKVTQGLLTELRSELCEVGRLRNKMRNAMEGPGK